jgi:uncharacterized protein YciI
MTTDPTPAVIMCVHGCDGRASKLEYFFYCRDQQDTGALRERWAEAHWSFMDRYAGSMIARGPTMTENGASQTGSMHMLTLPTLEAARVFVYEEPYYKLGVYRNVFMSRWHNALDRTRTPHHVRAASVR